jgi:pimeloyl-ACP methyl ester carboxylesterase
MLPMPHVEEVEHRFVTVDGLRLHYAEAGAGDPLVLVHGWPQHWWSWREAIGPLSERFRVICPDIRGLGWSEGSTSPGGYALHRLARDLLELLDALGIQRARLVGHDWGSAIGYRACLNWPDRFDRLVPMAGVHPWAVFSRPRLFMRPWHIYALAAIGAPGVTRLGIGENSLRSWRRVGRFTAEEEQVYMAPLRLPGATAATQQYDRNLILREIPNIARRHRSLRLHVPTLHLNGELDPLTQGMSVRYREFAPAMELEHVPNCGHFIAEEMPEYLVDRLMQFLD